MQLSHSKKVLDDRFPMQGTASALPIALEKETDKVNDNNSIGLFRILVVADDLSIQETYKHILDETAYSVDMCSNGNEALEWLSSNFYDLVITDLHLPGVGLDSIAILNWIRRYRPATTAVVISGDSSSGNILAAMREGARDYLVKPITSNDFREMIERWSQPQPHINREPFSSMLKQVMHDVRSEVLNLEIIIKMLQRGKIDKTGDGLSHSLGTMQAKLEHLKSLTTEYCLLARNLLQGGANILTERLGINKDVITPILDEMQVALHNKALGLSFKHDVGTIDDACVTGNRVMLKCVFRTLFGNAIKYCNDRSVISYGITSNGRRLKIHVANEGEVVPTHMRAKIFEEFIQARSIDSSCQTNGLGLGLALAKDILRQHGGDIWYEAMANGSKFVCTLTPCSAQSAG